MIALNSDGATGAAARATRVHGPAIAKNTGVPRCAAASTRNGLIRQLRQRALPGHALVGIDRRAPIAASTGVNALHVEPGGLEERVQSARRVRRRRSASGCGTAMELGQASRRIHDDERHAADGQRRVVPATGFSSPIGTSGRGLVRYQKTNVSGRAVRESLSSVAAPSTCARCNARVVERDRPRPARAGSTGRSV